MRLIKLASLAAIAAVTAMAFIGVGTAFAAKEKVVLCKTNVNLCPAAQLWGEHVTIKAKSKLAVLLGTLNVHCESLVTVLAEVSHKDRILGKVTQLSWSNCTGCGKATTLTLPTGSLFATGSGNGKLDTTSKTEVLLQECTFLKLDCTASANSASLSFVGGAIGSTALSEANEVPTSVSGAFCGSTGAWDAGPGSSEPYVVEEVNGATVG